MLLNSVVLVGGFECQSDGQMLNITFAPNDRSFFLHEGQQAILSNGRLGEDSDAQLQHALIMLMKDTESIWEIKGCYKNLQS